jgi:hypothetical protein
MASHSRHIRCEAFNLDRAERHRDPAVLGQQVIRISGNSWTRVCPSISGHVASATYRAGDAGAQATAHSERIRSWLVANRFHAISQASMMSARLINTELASQWLRR